MTDFAVSILRADERLELNSDPYYLMGITGIGAAPATRIEEHLAQQHGVTDYGYYLGPRRIALSVGIRASDYTSWHQRREALLSMLKAADTPVTLRIESGGQTRDIECYYSADLAMAPGQLATWQQATVELVAPDPLWHDPVLGHNSFIFGGGTQGFEVPLAVPVHVGMSSGSIDFALTYTGTWDSFPQLTLIGPATSFAIANSTLGLKLSFPEISLLQGETLAIDCRWGHKTVMRGADNWISKMSSDSDLTNFRIGAHPVPLGGENSFNISVTGISASSRLSMIYQINYVGV